MSDKDKVIEAFKNSEEPLNAKKVSELSGVEKKEVDKIMKELKLFILILLLIWVNMIRLKQLEVIVKAVLF